MSDYSTRKLGAQLNLQDMSKTGVEKMRRRSTLKEIELILTDSRYRDSARTFEWEHWRRLRRAHEKDLEDLQTTLQDQEKQVEEKLEAARRKFASMKSSKSVLELATSERTVNDLHERLQRTQKTHRKLFEDLLFLHDDEVLKLWGFLNAKSLETLSEKNFLDQLARLSNNADFHKGYGKMTRELVSSCTDRADLRHRAQVHSPKRTHSPVQASKALDARSGITGPISPASKKKGRILSANLRTGKYAGTAFEMWRKLQLTHGREIKKLEKQMNEQLSSLLAGIRGPTTGKIKAKRKTVYAAAKTEARQSLEKLREEQDKEVFELWGVLIGRDLKQMDRENFSNQMQAMTQDVDFRTGYGTPEKSKGNSENAKSAQGNALNSTSNVNNKDSNTMRTSKKRDSSPKKNSYLYYGEMRGAEELDEEDYQNGTISTLDMEDITQRLKLRAPAENRMLFVSSRDSADTSCKEQKETQEGKSGVDYGMDEMANETESSSVTDQDVHTSHGVPSVGLPDLLPALILSPGLNSSADMLSSTNVAGIFSEQSVSPQQGFALGASKSPAREGSTNIEFGVASAETAFLNEDSVTTDTRDFPFFLSMSQRSGDKISKSGDRRPYSEDKMEGLPKNMPI